MKKHCVIERDYLFQIKDIIIKGRLSQNFKSSSDLMNRKKGKKKDFVNLSNMID